MRPGADQHVTRNERVVAHSEGVGVDKARRALEHVNALGAKDLGPFTLPADDLAAAGAATLRLTDLDPESTYTVRSRLTLTDGTQLELGTSARVVTPAATRLSSATMTVTPWNTLLVEYAWTSEEYTLTEGQPQTTTLATFLIPTILDVPEIEPIIL